MKKIKNDEERETEKEVRSFEKTQEEREDQKRGSYLMLNALFVLCDFIVVAIDL